LWWKTLSAQYSRFLELDECFIDHEVIPWTGQSLIYNRSNASEHLLFPRLSGGALAHFFDAALRVAGVLLGVDVALFFLLLGSHRLIIRHGMPAINASSCRSHR
jgi:hypothetical protein